MLIIIIIIIIIIIKNAVSPTSRFSMFIKA